MSSNDTTVESVEAGGEAKRGRRPLAEVFKALSFSRISGLYVWAVVFGIFALWVPDTFLSGTT